jgi:monofunctional biosynthetic peptidoglycan transglycosylase
MKRVTLKTLSLVLKISLFFFFLLGALATWIFLQFPSDKEITGCLTTKLYKVELCPNSGKYVRLNQISEYMQKAVVLTEDSSFFQHKGFDFQEMENSLKSNLEKGKYARGGSTISQQLAKNLFLTKEKTLHRKFFEALITVRMEKILSKREILEKYLNVVQFGKNLYGIKAAAQFYFKKSPANLTLPESAFLVFLLPSPEKYSRSYFQGALTPFARKRVKTIMERMFTYQRVTDSEYQMAMAEIDQFIHGGKKETELNFEDLGDKSEEDLEGELEL